MVFYVVITFTVITLLTLYSAHQLKRKYNMEVREGLKRTKELEKTAVTEKDIAHLPEPIQKYLKYVGVLGKEKVYNIQVHINGTMRINKKSDWCNIKIQQYSFFDILTRLFYLRLTMNGLPIKGLHFYKSGIASMVIKILGLIPVVNGSGEKMNQAETVTVFNDMCIMAPATLIDSRIQWRSIDDYTVEATFKHNGIQITATLYFNELGQLVNFVSDDRYYSPTGETFEQVRWSTPIQSYQNINGFNLATYGEAIWSFPEGDFTYAKFYIQDIQYNLEKM